MIFDTVISIKIYIPAKDDSRYIFKQLNNQNIVFGKLIYGRKNKHLERFRIRTNRYLQCNNSLGCGKTLAVKKAVSWEHVFESTYLHEVETKV